MLKKVNKKLAPKSRRGEIGACVIANFGMATDKWDWNEEKYVHATGRWFRYPYIEEREEDENLWGRWFPEYENTLNRYK